MPSRQTRNHRKLLCNGKKIAFIFARFYFVKNHQRIFFALEHYYFVGAFLFGKFMQKEKMLGIRIWFCFRSRHTVCRRVSCFGNPQKFASAVGIGCPDTIRLKCFPVDWGELSKQEWGKCNSLKAMRCVGRHRRGMTNQSRRVVGGSREAGTVTCSVTSDLLVVNGPPSFQETV